jgi:hypothetical protein
MHLELPQRIHRAETTIQMSLYRVFFQSGTVLLLLVVLLAIGAFWLTPGGTLEWPSIQNR